MFKSYTRKSSAVVGAKRAGLSEDSVVNVDGSWGFYTNEEPVAAPEPVATVQETVVQFIKNDRRKQLRLVNRCLQAARKMNKKFNSSNEAVMKSCRLAQRNLRNGYRASMLPRYVTA